MPRLRLTRHQKRLLSQINSTHQSQLQRFRPLRIRLNVPYQIMKLRKRHHQLTPLRKLTLHSGTKFHSRSRVRPLLLFGLTRSWQNLHCHWRAQQRLGKPRPFGLPNARSLRKPSQNPHPIQILLFSIQFQRCRTSLLTIPRRKC